MQHSVLAALTIDEKPGMEHLGFDALCEQAGVDPRWLETFAVRMAISLDTHGKTRDVFAAEVRAFLRTAEWGNAKAPSSGSLGRLFRAPNEPVWDGVVSTSTGPSMAFSTVHGVKGKEYPGVVLVLPERLRVDDVTTRTVIDDWEGGHHTEARRVLYVAASRAQQLLICAIHKKHISRIEAVLDNTGVPYTKA